MPHIPSLLYKHLIFTLVRTMRSFLHCVNLRVLPKRNKATDDCIIHYISNDRGKIINNIHNSKYYKIQQIGQNHGTRDISRFGKKCNEVILQLNI
jgi:hypothetical protein